MIVYLVCRVPCEHNGELMMPMGVALTVESAIAMCSDCKDVISELETDKVYPPGVESPFRAMLPLCPTPSMKGWVTSRGLAFAEGPGVKNGAPVVAPQSVTGAEPQRTPCPGDPRDFTYNAAGDCWSANGTRGL